MSEDSKKNEYIVLRELNKILDTQKEIEIYEGMETLLNLYTVSLIRFYVS